jgi:hypothetical protein
MSGPLGTCRSQCPFFRPPFAAVGALLVNNRKTCRCLTRGPTTVAISLLRLSVIELLLLISQRSPELSRYSGSRTSQSPQLLSDTTNGGQTIRASGAQGECGTKASNGQEASNIVHVLLCFLLSEKVAVHRKMDKASCIIWCPLFPPLFTFWYTKVQYTEARQMLR